MNIDNLYSHIILKKPHKYVCMYLTGFLQKNVLGIKKLYMGHKNIIKN